MAKRVHRQVGRRSRQAALLQGEHVSSGWEGTEYTHNFCLNRGLKICPVIIM